MNKTKEELIEEYKNKPLEIGQTIEVKGLRDKDKNWYDTYEILGFSEKGNPIVLTSLYQGTIEIYPENWKHFIIDIGYNPLPKKRWDRSLENINFDLSSILHRLGFEGDNSRNEKHFGVGMVEELNWNPFILDSKGIEVYYQRNFCWSLKDKQLLIDSIYNYIDIGKIIVRKRSFEWCEKRVSKGFKTAFYDIVDGKQRLNAILDFIFSKYPDSNGFYYKDFSELAKREFLNFSAVSYGEIRVGATDEDIKKIFLNTNFTGVQMSQQHINFVKSINL